MSKLADKIAAKTADIKIDNEKREPKVHGPRTAPAIQFDATSRMHAAERKAEDLQNQLYEALKNGGVTELPLDLLFEEPNRRRTLSAEDYEHLKENLRHNDLVTPIVVRLRAAGGYEIVSGHNRTQVFRDLGRTAIPAIVADIDDSNVSKDAFYANLLHSSLPDYEKFLGFQQLLAEDPNLTAQGIATSSGFSTAQVSKILSFGELPKAALDLIKENPGVIGANLAQDLSLVAKNGREDKVVEAVQLVINRQLTQEQAKAFATKVPKLETKKAAPELITIKRGKSHYCKYRRAEKVIRLEFKTDEEANAVQTALLQLLELNAGKND
jgi:ParB family chromosome partitioning protein